MLEFFERDKSEFDGAENIRELYPLVDSLTGGQLAGLDFLSIKDMVVMAVSDENGFKDVDVSKIESASIYQDVNREIYEKGGVALTDAAMRAKATANEATPAFELSKLGIVLWSSTAAAGVAAAGSAAAWTKITAPEKSEILKRLDTLRETEIKAWNDYSLNSGIYPTNPELAAQHKQYLAQLEKTANQAGSDYNTLAA